MNLMTHKGTVTLESERLILRRFTEGDVDAIFRNLYSDAEAMRWLPWETQSHIAEATELINGYIDGYKNADYYAWAIVPKTYGLPIGFIDTQIDSGIDAVKIDYGIGKAWCRQGYTSTALSMLIKFFFEQVSVNRIYSTHDPRNPNSGAVMQKCGMVYEGTLRQTRHRKGEYSDRVYYAILTEDYFNKQPLE